MNTTSWRKDGRYVKDNPEINAIESFAAETIARKQSVQISGEFQDFKKMPPQMASLQISSVETSLPQESRPTTPLPQLLQDLPSEIVRVCIDGREAEMRVYGGVIRFLN